MGAKDDKKKPGEEAEPLNKKELESLVAVTNNISRAIAALDDSGVKSREFSLVLTKLEEAEMWLDRGFEEMGYEAAEEDDEDEDEGDEEEDEEDEEEDEEEEGA